MALMNRFFAMLAAVVLGLILGTYLSRIHIASTTFDSESFLQQPVLFTHYSDPTKNMTLSDMLLHFSKDRLIYLSSVDSSYVPMAINLYETSFKKLGIDNYLFACSDTKAHETLSTHGINSFDFLHDKDSATASKYNTKAFRRKTHMKTKLILEGLESKLTVIIVDVDIVLFKDPLPHLDCADCDIQIQSDMSEGNSGFYMTRPTKPSIDLHKKAWEVAVAKGEAISNQKALDRNMESMIKKKQIKVKTLSKGMFPPGCVYFENAKRMFYYDNPPKDEVLVHNNWIVSKEAKIYRFKEVLLWYVDYNGYYSEPTRRYLTYENPLDKTEAVETEALKAALIIGYILNRTVILPTFTCQKCKYGACKVKSKQCTFNTHYRISTFDSVFENGYREHVFLDHPLVPPSIRAQSEKYFIATRQNNSTQADEGIEIKLPQNSSKGPTRQEILDWFGAKEEPVLRFHSLYHALEGLKDMPYLKTVEKAINTKTDYRQY